MALQIPSVKLASGTEIPQLGFGVFLIPPDETVAAVTEALALGYRHIDTAQMYRNERQVGEAVRHSGIDRDDVFITTKLSNRWQTRDDALRAIERSLGDLGTERVDLLLIHWPLPTVRDFIDVWRALEEVHSDGRASAIGVSNFQIDHLRRLFDEGTVPPAVNQIEVHPYLTQEPLRSFGAAHGIVTEAWSPIARGKILDDGVIGEIARRHRRTPAQIVLRWHLQLGNVVFPKSSHPDRMRENLDLFEFALGSEDIDKISALNRDERIGPDPDTFAMVP